MVAIHQRPNTDEPATLHKIYPYCSAGSIELVKSGVVVRRHLPPMASGFRYLVVIISCVSAMLAPHQ